MTANRFLQDEPKHLDIGIVQALGKQEGSLLAWSLWEVRR
jgi:hypothetical protein